MARKASQRINQKGSSFFCFSQGDKQKNLADVTNFELNIPMLEYHNRLWTWLDFVLEVKMRIRRQLIKEVRLIRLSVILQLLFKYQVERHLVDHCFGWCNFGCPYIQWASFLLHFALLGTLSLDVVVWSSGFS